MWNSGMVTSALGLVHSFYIVSQNAGFAAGILDE